MKKAIFIRFVVAISCAILICGIFSSFILGYHEEDQTAQWLEKLSYTASRQYDSSKSYEEQVAYFSELLPEERITIIASDGTVLADSLEEAANMENHKDREEVKNAKEGEVVITHRTSSTLGVNLMYCAIQMPDGNILRFAHSYNGILQNIATQLPAILLAMVLALLLSAFLARTFSKSLAAPLEEVARRISEENLDNLPSNATAYDEIDKIVSKIQRLFQRIHRSKQDLALEKEKIDYILSSMNEGFVMFDENKDILLINHSAKNFFHCSDNIISQNILRLTRDIKLEQAVHKAIFSDKSFLYDMETPDGSIYSAHIAPVPASHYLGKGATLLLIDVTAERHSQQMRQEFFSNASHELKTPITSIRGFAELLNSGCVSDEKKQREILQIIEKQVQRMSDLINDILLISKLESGQVKENKILLNMKGVIKDCIASITPQAQAESIEIRPQLEDVYIYADRTQMEKLVINLVENAVKYNRQHGTVNISLEQKNSHLIFTVKDTGVGIPPESHNRIFERFYRVEPSRGGKNVQGTGLGLSIVKHIVASYQGTISLESTQGVGTKITVKLPLSFGQ